MFKCHRAARAAPIITATRRRINESGRQLIHGEYNFHDFSPFLLPPASSLPLLSSFLSLSLPLPARICIFPRNRYSIPRHRGALPPRYNGGLREVFSREFLRLTFSFTARAIPVLITINYIKQSKYYSFLSRVYTTSRV